jgi:ferric-dicitrate binding protein FerR (iron transport regulator)
MKKVSEYQAHADECRRLAAGTSNEEHRAALQRMAETWESLANDRAERILREARIEALENPPGEPAA